MAYNFYKNRKQQQAKQDSILDDNEKQDSKMQDLSPPKSTAIGFNNHFQQPPSVQQRRGGGFGELAESSSSSSNAVGKGGIPQQRGNNNPFGYGSPRPNIVVNKPAAQSQFSFGLSAGGNNNNMGLLGGQRDGDGLGQEPIGDQSSLINIRDKKPDEHKENASSSSSNNALLQSNESPPANRVVRPRPLLPSQIPLLTSAAVRNTKPPGFNHLQSQQHFTTDHQRPETASAESYKQLRHGAPNVYRRDQEQTPRAGTAFAPKQSEGLLSKGEPYAPTNLFPSHHPFASGRTTTLAAATATGLIPNYNAAKAVKSPMDINFPLLQTYLIPPNGINHYSQLLTPGGQKTTAEKRSILSVCGQIAPVPISIIFDHLKRITKLGEGVFGEVYLGYYYLQCPGSLGALPKVYKVIPIEGEKTVNGERQKRYEEIEPEILVSQRLNILRENGQANYTEAFARLNSALVCKGQYPKILSAAWKRFRTEKGSENDLPEFNDSQEYMVLESELYGTDVECYKFKHAKQALSLIVQVAHTLAVGEAGVKFEHRDLHWGNILVIGTKRANIHFKLNGQDLFVPSAGVKSTIIDFTIASAEQEGGQYIYTDLSHDDDQFNGHDDYQFEIYRMMRDELKNHWDQFTPKNNIYWLHYLADKLIKRGHYSESSCFIHRKYMGKLRYFKTIIKTFGSCIDFALAYEGEDLLKIDEIDVVP